MKLIKLNILFLSILILSCWLSSAQGGWKNKYYLPNSLTSECRDVLESPNGNIIMAGITLDSTGNKLTMIGSDSQGTLLWRKDYGRNKFEYLDNDTHMGRGLLKEGNYFYQVSCVRDSNNRKIGVLQKFDFNGDTIWQKIYRDSDSLEDVIPQGICKSVDDGLLITGCFQNSGANSYRKALLIKTDLNGNELWRKKIGKTPPDMVEVQDGKSIVQDSSTKRIVIVGYQYLGGGAAVFGNVLILDSLGVKILQTTYNNANSDPFYQVIQLKDKNFLTCGSINTFNDWSFIPRTKGLIVKFDINGAVIWTKELESASPFHFTGRIKELDNGDLVFADQLDTLVRHGLGILVKIRMILTDKNGETKYSRYVGSAYQENSDEFIRSMNACQDGGFVLAAWNYWEFPTPHAYNVIRIDSTFCDTLESWCKAVALELEELGEDQFASLRIFPNPANDYVNIDFNSAYSSDKAFSISLSDLSGRELQMISIQSQQNLNINTSSYSPGVYFVSLIKDMKVVARQKLVLTK